MQCHSVPPINFTAFANETTDVDEIHRFTSMKARGTGQDTGMVLWFIRAVST